jgi:hypothetical protein
MPRRRIDSRRVRSRRDQVPDLRQVLFYIHILLLVSYLTDTKQKFFYMAFIRQVQCARLQLIQKYYV